MSPRLHTPTTFDPHIPDLIIAFAAAAGVLILSILATYAWTAYNPVSRPYLNRVSFRLLIYALIANLANAVCQIVLIHSGPGAVFNGISFSANVSYMFSGVMFFCMTLNLQLVLIHGVNGQKMEKYYILGALALPLACSIPPYAAGAFGVYDPMRSTEPLVAAVCQETVDYLNRIRGLKSAADIEAWHHFCRNHENKKLRDWYPHKVQYPWLLPGYKESLSRFPPGFWSQTPNHTNLVESAHVATNQETGTKLTPLEAIELPRKADRAKALPIAAARETCISVNRNNSDRSRMQRSASRAARRNINRTQHSQLENSIIDTKKQLEDASKRKLTLTQRLKDFSQRRSLLVAPPRNSHSVDRFGTAGSIPHVSSRADGDSDSEVEIVNERLPATSQTLRFSSPAPSSSSGFNDVDLNDYLSDTMESRPASVPPSSSSGFDLASRASDFDSDEGGAFTYDNLGPEAGEDAGVDLHYGYYLLGAPGFDLNEFLDACGDASLVGGPLPGVSD
ncbi:hypothetical protein DFH09DRAFT_1347497 [Mycena vulgaris]|nr:hypothetical protein DFH09DRAFT_1347497 [Mycena vulgaris]